MNQKLIKQSLIGIFSFAALGGFVTTGYDSAQHDRRIQAGFRSAVLQDPTPHLMTIVTDGVTREGFLNQGAAFSQNSTTALIVANTPEAACWYTTLRVTDGQEKLPFWQKVFGGAETEKMFANQALDDMTCAPTGNGQTIGTVKRAPAAPAVKP